MPRPNAHAFVTEPLQRLPGYVERPMFGGRSGYFEGRMVVFLADGAEPWNGVLFPAERAAHPAILAEWPVLRPHAILPKWLYLPASAPDFEETAAALVARVIARDPRFGVVPPPKKKKRQRSGPPGDSTPPAADAAAAQAPAGRADIRPPHLR